MAASSSVYLTYINQLEQVDYYQSIEISEIEKEILKHIDEDNSDIFAYIVYMHCHIMLGNIVRAKSIAQKIWSIGGELPARAEALYIDDLINLGLLDMAEVLLKDKIYHMSDSIADFGNEIEKYLLVKGDYKNFDRFYNLDSDSTLSEMVAVYNQLNLGKHFSAVQKIIFDFCKDSLCKYEYKTYEDRGFPEVEIFIYTSKDQSEAKSMQDNLDKKINAFWVSSGTERLNNLIVTINNISTHKKDCMM